MKGLFVKTFEVVDLNFSLMINGFFFSFISILVS